MTGQLAAAGHQVIVPDLQGHGRTADVDRPISVVTMGEDIAALIGHLGLERPTSWATRSAAASRSRSPEPPELVRKLVIISTDIKRSAIYADMLAQQGNVGAAAADNLKGTPMYESYIRIAPRPEDFPRCWTRWARRWPRTSTSASRCAGWSSR